MTSNKLPYSVDWTKWGKIKKVELGAACGLLAGVDIQAYMYMQDYYDNWILAQSDSDRESAVMISAMSRKDTFAVEDRLLATHNIRTVVENHISSGCFIEIHGKEISRETAIDRSLHGQIPEDAKYFYDCFVNLPSFGDWAKANGYQLPPEFPTTTDINIPKSDGASKGGKARAAIYEGAKEVCRAEAKAMRLGKQRGEKPDLDLCARLIDESRDSFEEEHKVTLPSASTIRGYLKTKTGEDPI